MSTYPNPEKGMEPEAPNSEGTLRMLKNVVVISISFLLLFTAFQSMSQLQSSINQEEGLGIYSLSVIYASLVLSSLFVPSFLIRTLSVKWTLVVCMLCYSTYIGAQFYPTFYTLIPAACILGFGAAPMWSAKCTYLTQVANKYSEAKGKSVEKTVVRFFGIFFFFFQCSSILGHVISSLVLKRQSSNYTLTEEDLANCGINFCSARNTTENFGISSESRWMLSGIFLGCSLLSVIVVTIFVDPLTRYGENERNEGGKKLSGLRLLIATLIHIIQTKQLLIIPLTFWSGVEQGFFGADFTAAYVTCVLGIEKVGYVLICYGACDAIFSYFLGTLIKYVGRVPIFYFGALVNAAVILTFFYWMPTPEEYYVFYILSGLWGIADAVWQTQINAFYGVMFEGDEEPAFSNYRLWESLGFITAYILQDTVCVHTKVWVLVGVLSAGIIGYTIIEIIIKLRKKDVNM
eukprot:TRINITY_DN1512_c1_g1_i1.p1 TRINITY_DN1512_c1_g1~~TRINITY_DN1512_c1_g1_i1.p1  ORF type:complete len:461 (+),score=77.14 TRINITY_DN1512_c1_g1_i1:3453-4835(+)